MSANQPSDKPRTLRETIQSIASEFTLIYPARHGAALAYYGIFALAPMIYIILQVANFFLDDLLTMFVTQIENLTQEVLGPEVVEGVQDLMDTASEPALGGQTFLVIIGILALLYTAAGAFAQVKYSVNTIWGVPAERQVGLLPFIIARLIGMAIVIGLGLVLVAMVVINYALLVFSNYLPFGIETALISFIALCVALIFAFALMYKFLPDVDVRWRSAWIGAICASLLVTIGLLVVFYILQNTNLTSAIAAAGSFFVILVSFNYFAQIFLLGAVITKVLNPSYVSHPVDLDHTL
jgi:membrane protein